MAVPLTSENITSAIAVLRHARDFLERIDKVLAQAELTEEQRAILYDEAEETYNAASNVMSWFED